MKKTTITCRFCKEPLKHTFVDLGLSPVANDYIRPENKQVQEPFFPLHVYVCSKCFLVQLPDTRTEDEIFRADYAYFSSYSASWLAHSKAYVDMITDRLGLTSAHQVVELASNDGYLLQYFQEKNIPVLGIEPSLSVAKAAQEKGIETLVKFFGVDTAQELAKAGKKADLLLGNNVLAHVPDLNDFVAGMKILLKDSGTLTMEFPHLLKLMTLNQFDTIYHEHFSYFSFTTVSKIFAHHGLTLFDVEELPTHGGSLRIYGRHSGKDVVLTDRAKALLAKEKAAKLTTLAAYKTFQKKVEQTRKATVEFLTKLHKQGKMIVGYGAPAKGNTLLNYCGIKSDIVSYTVDKNPHKQNHFLPGVRIPIFNPEKIQATKPDYVFILPWNIKDEIMDEMQYIRTWGGKFIVAIPKLHVYS